MADEATQEDPPQTFENETQAAEALEGLLADDPFVVETFGPVEDAEGQGDPESQVEDEDTEDEDFEDIPEEDLEEAEDFEDDEPDDLDDEVDEEPEDETSDPDESQTYTVQVDGEEIEVTLDEALAGYQRREAFTRKTQEIARERDALREEAQELAEEQQQYLERLQVVNRALELPEPDWEQIKAQRGEQEYTRLRAQYADRQKQIEAIESEIQETKEAMREQQLQHRQEIREREQELLLSERPEWLDPEKKRKAAERLYEGALEEYGFSHEEFENALDHRIYLLLDDALSYREMQSKSTKAKEEARSNRRKGRNLKPGSSTKKNKKSSKSKKAAAARKRLAQTGRTSDAADALDFLLPDDIV